MKVEEIVFFVANSANADVEVAVFIVALSAATCYRLAVAAVVQIYLVFVFQNNNLLLQKYFIKVF